jgi:hypothetical protein
MRQMLRRDLAMLSPYHRMCSNHYLNWYKIKIPEIIERDIKCFLSTWFQFLLLCLTHDSVIFEKPENHGKYMVI